MKKFFTLLLCFTIIFASPAAAIAAEDEFTVIMPPTVYGTVGKEMNIYFDNITLCSNLKNYRTEVVCDYGERQNERWTYTPSASGSFEITINFYKYSDGTLAGSAQSTVMVSDVSGTGSTQKLLIIGDSWTDYTTYPSQIYQNFKSDQKDSVIMLGTKIPWGAAVRHEGRSGWNTNDYMSAGKGNVTNLFYNTQTGKFDLSYYLEQNKDNLHNPSITLEDETPDIVIIFLGINDVSQVPDRTQIVSNLNTMIDSIHSVSADIKVGLVLTPPPAYSQDGFGKVNKCANTRFSQKIGAMELNRLYLDNFSNKTNVFIIPANVNIDCVNNYKYEEVKANAYSDIIIKRATDNVHPAAEGFYQCADAIYAALKAICY